MRIGLAGVGRMGSVFAARLLDHHFQLGTWSRNQQHASAFAARGCCQFSTPGLLAEASDIIISSLADETALDAVYLGPDGLLSGDVTGKVFVDTSTISPRYIRSLADKIESRGAMIVDSPVLGTVGPAREGKLVAIMGGGDVAIKRAQAPMAALCRRIVHVGPTGTGAAMKLVVNMLLAVYWQTLGEALAMGERNGLAMDQMLDVLMDSPVATTALQVKLPLLRGDKAEVGFSIAGVQKDLSLAVTSAHAVSVPALTASSALACYVAAAEASLSDKDVAAIVSFVRAAKQAISR